MSVILWTKRILSQLLSNPIIGLCVTRFRPLSGFHGVQVDLRNPFMPPNVKAAVFWNIYESAEARLILKWIPRNKPVVELGASLGIISRVISSSIQGRIICVEANSSLLPSIKFNLDSIKKNSYKIINKAISCSARPILFSWEKGSNLTGRIDPNGNELVNCISLSRLLVEESIEDYSLVMDIEGAEIEIFMEDLGSLKNCEFIIAELHSCTYLNHPYSAEDLSLMIIRAGFDLVDRDGNCFAYNRPIK